MGNDIRAITRARPSLSCLPCRRRKVKCEKQKPACSHCLRLNDKCVYELYPSEVDGPDKSRKKRRLLRDQPQNEEDREDRDASFPHSIGPPDCAILAGDKGMSEVQITEEEIIHNSMPLPSKTTHMTLIQTDSTTLPTPRRNLVDKLSSTTSLGNPQTISPSIDLLNQNGTTRYPKPAKSSNGGLRKVESVFWALADTKLIDGNQILPAQHLKLSSENFSQKHEVELSSILSDLPSKKECDSLLQTFIVGVLPLIPIIHLPTFIVEYDEFWARCDRNAFIWRSHNFFNDTSFLCLLWAVLFCGAVATPPLQLTNPTRSRPHEAPTDFVKLRRMFEQTLSLSMYTKLPTLKGLVATLLVQECDPEIDDMLMGPLMVSQAIQTARALNLHKEEAILAMDEVESEISRRVWYHIVYWESLNAIAAGSIPALANSEDCHTTKPPQELRDSCTGFDSLTLNAAKNASPQSPSSILLLNIGKCETSQMIRHIAKHCYTHMPDTDSFSTLTKAMKQFEDTIDVLISRLKAKGIPEKGHISAQLFNAYPHGNDSLCQYDPNKESVFNAYGRIVLSMIKNIVSVFFNRQFLIETATIQSEKISSWSRVISCSRQVLTNYLYLSRLPAFSPYQWLFPGRLQPLQDCLLHLSYLKTHPKDSSYSSLRYLIKEIFDIFIDNKNENSISRSLGVRRYEPTWQTLHRVWCEIDAEAEPRAEENSQLEFDQPTILTLSNESESEASSGIENGLENFTSFDFNGLLHPWVHTDNSGDGDQAEFYSIVDDVEGNKVHESNFIFHDSGIQSTGVLDNELEIF